MKVAVFSTKPYDRQALLAAREEAKAPFDFHFLLEHLRPATVSLARDFPAICTFVNDELSAPVLEALATGATRSVVLRCAGFNQVDLHALARLNESSASLRAQPLTVARVPAYDPAAVAEHALALMLTLSRHTHRAFNRVREGNFSLDGQLGFTFRGKTAGILGLGKIGMALARILAGMGMRVLAVDPLRQDRHEVQANGIELVDLPTLYREADVLSLHCPLTPQTHHLIDHAAVAAMKPGVMLINTSRGAVMESNALVDGLKSGRIGYLGLDVYEQEGDLFFEDLSMQGIADDVFVRLMTFPNVLITGHQGFFTAQALAQIASTTIENLRHLTRGTLPQERQVGLHVQAKPSLART